MCWENRCPAYKLKPQFYIFVGTALKWHEIQEHIKSGKHCSYGHLAGPNQNVYRIEDNAEFRNVIPGFHCIQCRHVLLMKVVTAVAFTLLHEMYCSNFIFLCLFQHLEPSWQTILSTWSCL